MKSFGGDYRKLFDGSEGIGDVTAADVQRVAKQVPHEN